MMIKIRNLTKKFDQFKAVADLNFDVSEGEEVQEGQTLCVVEAMKMENVLYAEQLGVIKKINFVEGGILSLDDKIIEFE